MELLNLYVKQDGMYNTLKLLITDKETNDLPNNWYFFSRDTFINLVKIAYKDFFGDYCCTIKVNAEDEYNLDLETLKKIVPELMF